MKIIFKPVFNVSYKRLHIIYPLICFFLTINLYAQRANKVIQTKKFSFEHIDADKGFMQNSVHVINQDSQGFMWFGTPNGLYKYDGYNFNIYRHEDKDPFSLSENLIINLFEDENNFLWIATDKELNILNKKTNKFYSHVIVSDIDDNTHIDRIKSITQDNNGVIWLGTNSGIYRVDKNSDFPTSISYQKVKFNLSAVLNINTLLKRKNGEIIIGTTRGLYRMNPDHKPNSNKEIKIKDVPAFKGLTILSIYEDKGKTVWIGTNKGLYKLNSNSFSNTEIVSKIDLKEYTRDIQNIIKDHKDNLWLGTNNSGLIQYNTVTKKIRKFHRDPKNTERGLLSNSILDLYKDEFGVLWIGTSRGGLSKLDLYKKNFIHYKSSNKSTGLNDNFINAFYEEDNQDVWIGTFNGGLSRLTNKNGKLVFKSYKLSDGLNNVRAFTICKDNYGYLWVGTNNNGLFRLKLDSNNEIISKTQYTVANTNGNLPTNKINLMYKDKVGDIWLGSFIGNNGLMKFTPTKDIDALPKVFSYLSKTNDKNSLTNNKLASIYEDTKGVLWVGTKGGLTKIIRDENNQPLNYTQYTNDKKNPNSLSNNNVFSIQEDSKGSLWVGTFGGGLNKVISETKNDSTYISFKSFKVEDGLPDNIVYGIIEDNDSNLWLSTNNGLSKYNTEKSTFKNYNTTDGIQSRNFRKFAYHKGLSGLMYFGGINGFNVFDPSDIKDHLTLPKTVITDFKIFNESIGVNDTVLGKQILSKFISYTDQIELKYKHNAFSFDFASIHYSSPEQNRYAYTLENFDTKWNYTDSKRRFVSYSNLDPGDYIFKVKSSNKDNVWNEDFSQIQIHILPPIWKTWWMYTIYGLIILALMWAFRHYILIKERFNTEIKLQKFEQEKIKEVNKMKLQFFTNVSHEFKTPLTLILGPIEKLINSDETSISAKSMLKMMQRNANQLYNLIQQVLEFRKVENNEMKLNVTKIDIVKLCNEILLSFKVLSDKKSIELIFESSQKELIDLFDVDKLNKIFNNLISNALKFTPENGEILLKLNVKSDGQLLDKAGRYVEISVIDTGSGIPSNKLPFIFKRFYQANTTSESNRMGSGVGLALTKSLVGLHQGDIIANSKEKKGTNFIVRLPLDINYENLENTAIPYLYNADSPISETINDDEEIYHLEQQEEHKKPLILVVEDNDDMRSFIIELLNDEYEVIEAANGLKGKQMALESIPDLIISDVMMPEMNGKELCRTLKSNEISSHIPIILLTAKASIENQILGIKLGADAYIPKPFNTEFLSARVKNLLESRELLRKKYNVEDGEDNLVNSGLNEYDKQFLEKAEEIIEENLMNLNFGVNDLGSDLAYSRMQLYRKLKSIADLSANEFIRAYRLKKAAKYLKESNMNISEILYQVGFANRSYFTKCFKLQYGKTPREYKDNI